MQHRSIARIFGIIDMVFSVLYSVLLTILLILLAVLGRVFINTINGNTNDNYKNKEQVETAGTLFFALIGIVLLVFGVLCFLKVLASWKLIKGTSDDVDPTGGLRFCGIWRGITIFFVVLQVLGCISWFAWGASALRVVFNLITLIFNISALYFVQRYMNHLESNLQREPLNDVACK